MTVNSIGGDFSWTGAAEFTGAINLTSISSASTVSISGATGSTYTDVTQLSIDSPDIYLAPTSLTATIHYGAHSVYHLMEGLAYRATVDDSYIVTASGQINIESFTGASYVDHVAIAFDAPDFNIARVFATSLTFGNNLLSGTMDFDSIGFTAATSAQFNALTLDIGIFAGSTTAINVGNASCATTIDATSLKLSGFSNAAGSAGVYANALLPANKAYLVIDTVTGAISSVTPS